MTDGPVSKALAVTRALGIPDEEVKPILKELLRVYDKNWTHIAEDNYRTLLDAYFEQKENKGKEDRGRSLEEHDGSARPVKRQNLAVEELASPTVVDSNKKLGSEVRKLSSTTSKRGIMKSSQPCLTGSRLESKASVLYGSGRPVKRQNLAIEEERASPTLVDSNKKLGSEVRKLSPTTSKQGILKSSQPYSTGCRLESKAPVLYGDRKPKPMNEPSCSLVLRENVSNEQHKKGVTKLSTEKSGVCSLALSRKPITGNEKRPVKFLNDITKGTEKVKISLVDDIGNENLPNFNYIPQNIIYQNANINISLARLVDEDCCASCSGDCLSSSVPCACARETGGEFAYTPQGLLKEEFLRCCMAMRIEPQEKHFVYCRDCPLEKAKNDYNPEQCKGHLIRKFIKECWRKCGCDMQCGNRVVQRGISCKLQVFLTREGKGWGVRPLEALPKGAFVCEYIGEVLTNTELYERNMGIRKERHTYPVTLDADWGSEKILRDEEALCLDATFIGNVARFINHRCADANLVDIPVEVETPDRHYYHLAFFTTRKVAALEELTWDYGIDFDDIYHPIDAFTCSCGSEKCRDRNKKG